MPIKDFYLWSRFEILHSRTNHCMAGRIIEQRLDWGNSSGFRAPRSSGILWASIGLGRLLQMCLKKGGIKSKPHLLWNGQNMLMRENCKDYYVWTLQTGWIYTTRSRYQVSSDRLASVSPLNYSYSSQKSKSESYEWTSTTLPINSQNWMGKKYRKPWTVLWNMGRSGFPVNFPLNQTVELSISIGCELAVNIHPAPGDAAAPQRLVRFRPLPWWERLAGGGSAAWPGQGLRWKTSENLWLFLKFGWQKWMQLPQEWWFYGDVNRWPTSLQEYNMSLFEIWVPKCQTSID